MDIVIGDAAPRSPLAEHDLVSETVGKAAEPLIESQRREEWLEKRRLGIGSSDAAAVVGLDPWRTALDVYADKTGAPPVEYVTERARLKREEGRLLQPLILREFEERTTIRTLPSDVLYRSRAHPFMVTTPDGFGVTDRDVVVVEAKRVGGRMRGGWEADIPEYVKAQVAHHLIVLGLDRAFVPALFEEPVGGAHFRWYEFRLTVEVREFVVSCEADFWQRVQAGEPPPIDGSGRAAEALARMYPVDNGLIVQLPEAAAEWDRARLDAIAAEKEARARREAAEARLKEAIGEAAWGVLPDGLTRYSWKEVSRKGYSVRATTHRELRRYALPATKG